MTKLMDIKRGMFIKIDPDLKVNLNLNSWHKVLDVKEDRIYISVPGYQQFFITQSVITEVRTALPQPKTSAKGENKMTKLKEYTVTIQYEPTKTTTNLLAYSNAHAIALAMSRVENEYDNKVSEVIVQEKGGK